MLFRAGRPHDLFDGETHGGVWEGVPPPQETQEIEKTAACTMLFRAGRPHYPFRVFRVWGWQQGMFLIDALARIGV